MRLHVQCGGGPKGSERPVRFQLDHRDLIVEEVLDQWYGPDDERYFKVRADDGNLYVLRHHKTDDQWSLESFWRATPSRVLSD